LSQRPLADAETAPDAVRAEAGSSARPAAETPVAFNLKRSAIRGTAWNTGGYAMAQLLRLGSSMVLTRLLVPEVYGLSALILTFSTAISMLTDVGLDTSIIRNARGTDPAFLNTAWTIQVIRGVVLFLIACLIAWPVSVIYAQPEVLKLLPALGVNMFITSLVSTRLSSQSRQLRLARVTMMDVATQILSIIVTISWASVSPTIWAIVAGILVGTVARTSLSHLILPGIPNRFAWDPTARSELVRFGRWIFVATAFTLLITQGDRLVLSTFVSLAVLGVYSIGAQLAQIATTMVGKVSSGVLFPLYSRIAEQGPELLRSRLLRVRRAALAGTLPMPVLLVAFGDQLVMLLYSNRFADAGWMVQLLSIGTAFDIITLTMSPIILAQGDSFRHMVVVMIRGVLYLTLMILGGSLAGIQGLVGGVVLSQLLTYPILAIAIRKSGTWMPLLDLLAITGSIAFGAICWLFRPTVGALFSWVHGVAVQLLH
jgi:O-antigen/teichoic acid export membrane protein